MPVVPYLCSPDANAAFAFYTAAFGAIEHSRWTDTATGKVGHGEFSIGDSHFYISDEWPEGNVYAPNRYPGSTVAFVIESADLDATWAAAIAAGATVSRAITEEPDGRRGGWLIDPSGYRWGINAPSPELSKAELNERMEGAYAVT